MNKKLLILSILTLCSLALFIVPLSKVYAESYTDITFDSTNIITRDTPTSNFTNNDYYLNKGASFSTNQLHNLYESDSVDYYLTNYDGENPNLVLGRSLQTFSLNFPTLNNDDLVYYNDYETQSVVKGYKYGCGFTQDVLDWINEYDNGSYDYSVPGINAFDNMTYVHYSNISQYCNDMSYETFYNYLLDSCDYYVYWSDKTCFVFDGYGGDYINNSFAIGYDIIICLDNLDQGSDWVLTYVYGCYDKLGYYYGSRWIYENGLDFNAIDYTERYDILWYDGIQNFSDYGASNMYCNGFVTNQYFDVDGSSSSNWLSPFSFNYYVDSSTNLDMFLANLISRLDDNDYLNYPYSDAFNIGLDTDSVFLVYSYDGVINEVTTSQRVFTNNSITISDALPNTDFTFDTDTNSILFNLVVYLSTTDLTDSESYVSTAFSNSSYTNINLLYSLYYDTFYTISFDFSLQNIVTGGNYYFYVFLIPIETGRTLPYFQRCSNLATTLGNSEYGSSSSYSIGATPTLEYNIGFESDSAYQVGYSDGYEIGLNTGQAQSYTNGYNAGESVGYSRGFTDGLEQNVGDPTITGLLFSIFQVPITVLSSLFSFTIFGTEVWYLFVSLLVLGIVIWLLRKILFK